MSNKEIYVSDPVANHSRLLLVESAARLAHQVNRDFRIALGEEAGPTWDEASEEMRTSTRIGVALVLDSDNPTPEGMHASWMHTKELQGWKHGAVKDEVEKTHPNMLPYDQLPPMQRMKDHIFISVVREFAAIPIPNL